MRQLIQAVETPGLPGPVYGFRQRARHAFENARTSPSSILQHSVCGLAHTQKAQASFGEHCMALFAHTPVSVCCVSCTSFTQHGGLAGTARQKAPPAGSKAFGSKEVTHHMSRVEHIPIRNPEGTDANPHNYPNYPRCTAGSLFVASHSLFADRQRRSLCSEDKQGVFGLGGGWHAYRYIYIYIYIYTHIYIY